MSVETRESDEIDIADLFGSAIERHEDPALITGEAGTIASPMAVVNAVRNALETFGVTHIDMPLAAENVWKAVVDTAEES